MNKERIKCYGRTFLRTWSRDVLQEARRRLRLTGVELFVVCPSMSGMRGGDERSHQRKRAPALRVCLHWSYSASCYVFKERRGALIDPRIPASWSNDLSFTRRRCWTWQQMENLSKWVHINYINTFSRLLFVILAKLQRKLHGCVIWTWSFIDLIKS